MCNKKPSLFYVKISHKLKMITTTYTMCTGAIEILKYIHAIKMQVTNLKHFSHNKGNIQSEDSFEKQCS